MASNPGSPTRSEWLRLRILLCVLAIVAIAYGLAAPRIAALQRQNQENARRLAALQEAYTSQQRREQALIGREEELHRRVTDSTSDPREWCELASLIASRDQGEAIRLLERAADRFPTSASVYATLSTLYQETGRPEESLTSLQRAHEIAPENPLIIAAIANVFVGFGWSREANRVLKQARPADKGNPSLQVARANLAIQTGDFRTARKLLEPFTHRADSPDEVLAIQAQALLGEGEYQNASSLLEKVLSRNPSHFTIRVALLEALLEKGDPQSLQQAAEVAKEGLRRHDHPALRRLLGLSLARAGDCGGALDYLVDAARSTQSDVSLLTAAASCLRQLGRDAEARQFSEDASAARTATQHLSQLRSRANLADGNVSAIMQLALEYRRQGNAPFARIELRRVLMHDPQNARAGVLLAQLPAAALNP